MTWDHLKATHECNMVDEQSRILYPLEMLAKRESETALGHLFQYWRRRCDGDKPPLEHEFNPIEVLPPKIAKWVYWIDATPENPLIFVFRDRFSVCFPDTSGKRLREIPNKMHVSACAAEYIRCKSFMQPMYHEIDQILGRISRHYVRLLVPVTDRKGRVSKLYNANRLIYLDKPGSGQWAEA